MEICVKAQLSKMDFRLPEQDTRKDIQLLTLGELVSETREDQDSTKCVGDANRKG